MANPNMKYRRWPDVVGMVAALACALHCATLTVVFLLYPTLWLKRKYWESGLWLKLMWLEWGLLALTWLILLLAMSLGWRRHRQPGPGLLALLAAGGMTLVIATPLHNSGYWTSAVAVLAGILVATAHVWNLRLPGQV